MANLTADGLDGLMLALSQAAEFPDELCEAMLDAEAAVVMPAIQAEAAKLGMGYDAKNNNARDTSATNFLPGQTRSYATGELARSVKLGKLKRKGGQAQKHIYFAGSRKRGKKRTRNAEIAFLNEFGTRTINARQFVWRATHKAGEAAEQAAARAYDAYLRSKGL